jgi:preprotein translocase subunit SecG
MYQALIVFHVLFALGIIGLVMMQQGRGADAGAAFGSGASGTVFGARGAASFLTRSTAVLALLFFASSLLLAIIADSPKDATDLMETVAPVEQPLEDLPPAVEGAATSGRASDLPDAIPEAPPAQAGQETVDSEAGSAAPAQPEANTGAPTQRVQEEQIETVEIEESAQEQQAAPDKEPAEGKSAP